MTGLEIIERRLDRIETLLSRLVESTAPVDDLAGIANESRRLIALAKINPEAAKAEAKRIAAVYRKSRRKG